VIFVTVGTQFPFDRLVMAIDDAVGKGLIEEKVYAQIGNSAYQPDNFESACYLNGDHFDRCVQNASALIGHAGMGTINAAMDNNKPLLVVPRLARYREVVNDHQVAIAREFARLKLLLLAETTEALPEYLPELKTFMPAQRNNRACDVARRISIFLNSFQDSYLWE